MFMTRKRHEEIVREATAELGKELRDWQYRSYCLSVEAADLRAFKAKVMKGLIEANAKRKAEKEGV